MHTPPKWYKPVAIIALIWNLLGCMAYMSDVMMSPEDAAKLSPAEQTLYAERTSWAVSGTAIAVWCGALGSLGLVLRKRWALPLLIVSLVGIIVQDTWLFALSSGFEVAGAVGLAMQGLVFFVAIALVILARTATQHGWIPAQAA